MYNQQFIFDYLMTLVDSRRLDINKPYAVGRTLLHAAASQTNNTHYIRVLMQYGLEPDALDDGFQTLLGRAVILRHFEGAEIMLSDPRYDKAKVFETPHRIGYFLFEYHVFGSLRAVWPELAISQIEFYDSFGATKAAMTRSHMLRCLLDDWPSIREDVRGFNSWVLDWALERMQVGQINYQDDDGGYAVLHLMGYHANFDGVAAMLQCDKADRYVLTRKNMSVFDCIFVEDGTPFPDKGRCKGVAGLPVALKSPC
ncbi:hypothetical protein FVEN_g121 [Fusarium venenatum]|nr:hypothetical protein FVEN_g121 [Fusarium venenatum]